MDRSPNAPGGDTERFSYFGQSQPLAGTEAQTPAGAGGRAVRRQDLH
jgi:hypothetical protein